MDSTGRLRVTHVNYAMVSWGGRRGSVKRLRYTGPVEQRYTPNQRLPELVIAKRKKVEDLACSLVVIILQNSVQESSITPEKNMNEFRIKPKRLNR